MGSGGRKVNAFRRLSFSLSPPPPSPAAWVDFDVCGSPFSFTEFLFQVAFLTKHQEHEKKTIKIKTIRQTGFFPVSLQSRLVGIKYKLSRGRTGDGVTKGGGMDSGQVP